MLQLYSVLPVGQLLLSSFLIQLRNLLLQPCPPSTFVDHAAHILLKGIYGALALAQVIIYVGLQVGFQLTYRSQVPEDTDFSSMNYIYDAEGSLIQRGVGNNYDSFIHQSFGDALTRIQKVRNGSVQETIEYGYDGEGNRVRMTDSQGTRYFLYDGIMPLLETLV